ncbi:MAG: hypothetical protein AAF360_14205 [Pseudomonadota bacterium]
MLDRTAAVLLAATLSVLPVVADEPSRTPLLTVPPEAVANGFNVYLSDRITASPTGDNRPAPIMIGRAPETFHCAISDIVVLQSGRQPNPRNGSRACSISLEKDAWMLRVRNVQMIFKEGVNTRVECQAICMEARGD